MTLPRSQRHLLVRGGTVVTLDAERRVLSGDVLVSEGRIAALGPNLSPPPATRLLEASGLIVLPGLVQAHVHLSHRLFRGWVSPDGPVWRSPRVIALERHHDDETAQASVLLGAAECLLSGTTTVAEFGLEDSIEGIFRGLEESGIRALAGPVIREESAGSRAGTDADRLERRLRELDESTRGRIHGSIQVDEADPAATDRWVRAAQLAGSLGVPMHTHLGGGVLGREALTLLERCGALGRFVILAHGPRLDPGIGETLGSRRIGIVYCPVTETRWGWGPSDPAGWPASRGGHVALSADGAGGRDGSDVWEMLRFVRALRGERGPSSDSRELLESVTRQGAAALGLEQELGSIEPGKAGDLLVLDLEGPGSFASGDASIYDRVVAGGGRHAVRWVVVDGEVVVDHDSLPHLDEGVLRGRPAAAARELRRRSESSNT